MIEKQAVDALSCLRTAVTDTKPIENSSPDVVIDINTTSFSERPFEDHQQVLA